MPSASAPVSGRWSRRLNRWLDPEGPFHLTKDDLSPSCGARFRSMEGPLNQQPDRSHCCGRCLKTYDNRAAQ